ncbi:hypothetical protein E3T46_07835 [Cryobacterium sp. Hh11]|uniref:hypothetical protein n=1 Tax=Cryobacterium sp. Hh11 TaxID=2555868 RepID=UPI00106BF1D5|nr:hypothetical protein [Cryobacterium sp. Hh11]TFD51990.1 hypothetical protein E3T46_07835 [Cryobacterium sp. Hh11]
MTAVDEIQAAIEKLTKLKLNAYRGAWKIVNKSMQGDHGLEHEKCDIQEVANGSWTEDDGYQPALLIEEAELIVTLHRTIDAQLAILADFVDRYALRAKSDWVPIAPAAANTLALARAINGTD